MNGMTCFKYIIILAVLCLTMVMVVYPEFAYAQKPAEIASTIYQLKKQSLDSKLKMAGFSTTPDYFTMRLYKANAEIEIWAGTGNQQELKKIAVYPICAMDFKPGTKLREGDERTPEGSFSLSFSYRSSKWFMHIDLNHPENEGDEKADPAFYMCTD